MRKPIRVNGLTIVVRTNRGYSSKRKALNFIQSNWSRKCAIKSLVAQHHDVEEARYLVSYVMSATKIYVNRFNKTIEISLV